MSIETPPREELLEWYEGRRKHPELYVYSPEGDLMILDKDGTIERVIQLPNYRPPTFEEQDKAEIERLDKIAAAQKVFEDAREALRSAISSQTATVREQIRLNRAIEEADIALQAVRHPLQDVLKDEKFKSNMILFDDPYEQRIMKDIVIMITRPFTLEEQYVRTEPLEAVPEPVQEVKLPKRKKRPVILFKLPDTNQYGFMSLDWPVIFDYNDISYRSAKHALLGEFAREIGDTGMFERIQSIEDPMDLAFTYSDFKDTTEETWNMKRGDTIQEITRQKFMQHPELAEQLVLTGNAHLGADIIDDTLLGIGLSMDNPKALKYDKWIGQNLLGKSLEAIRSELKRGRREQEQVGVQEMRGEPVANPVLSAAKSVAESAATAAVAVADAVVDTVADTVAATTEAVSAAVTAPVAAAEAPAQPSKKRTLRIVRP